MLCPDTQPITTKEEWLDLRAGFEPTMKRYEEGLKREDDERKAADKIIDAELQKTLKQVDEMKKQRNSQ